MSGGRASSGTCRRDTCFASEGPWEIPIHYSKCSTVDQLKVSSSVFISLLLCLFVPSSVVIELTGVFIVFEILLVFVVFRLREVLVRAVVLGIAPQLPRGISINCTPNDYGSGLCVPCNGGCSEPSKGQWPVAQPLCNARPVCGSLLADPHWAGDPKCSFNGTSPVEAPVRAAGGPLSHLGHQGSTPLHIAAYRGHRDVVQLLISAGPLGVDLTSRPRVGRGSHCRDLP